jgi:hypothetical protein
MSANVAKQFRDSVVFPALNHIGLYSLAAEKLLMGTAAIESRFVIRIQFRGGPARGLFQMEPPTFKWLLEEFLAGKRHVHLKQAVLSLAGSSDPSPDQLTTNDLFAAAMARVRYYAVPSPIPLTLDGQAKYWRHYYNGESPHGLKEADYIRRWNELCASLYAPPSSSSSPQTSGYPYPSTQGPIWV